VPDFIFAATDSSGNKVQGKATADDMGAAVLQVAGMGYSLLHIELVSPPVQNAVPQLQNTTTQMAAQPAPQPPPVRLPPSQQVTTQIAPQPAATHADPAPQKQADLLRVDAAKRMKAESDLSRLGMSPDEIRRLMDASATTFEADPKAMLNQMPLPSGAPAQLPLVPGSAKSKRVSASSLESFAAQLNSTNAARNNAAIREVNLGLPEFRESTTAETIQAETLLRDASMLRRREKFKDAEQKARQAIALTPKDAAALELLGDILQGVGRVDEAIAAYKRAVEADPKRTAAERKYGDLLMRQQNWNFGDPEAVAPNRWLNSILSLLPGVGQLFNGDWVKAGLFFTLDLICGTMIWMVTKPGPHSRSIELAAVVLTIVTYISAIMDSNISTNRKRTG